MLSHLPRHAPSRRFFWIIYTSFCYIPFFLSRGRKRALWRKLQREPEPEPEPEVPLVADGVWLGTVNQNELYILPWLGIAAHFLSVFWKRDFETELYPDRLRTIGWI